MLISVALQVIFISLSCKMIPSLAMDVAAAQKLETTAKEENLQLYSSCGAVIDGSIYSKGIVTSPNYPNQYPIGLSCKWTIKGGRGRRVILKFQDFDITRTDDCQEDYLSISSVDSPNNITTGLRLCGGELPMDVISEGDVLFLQMRTSEGDTCKGFSARYSLEEVVSTCGAEISALEFDFETPNYPQPIRNETAHCRLSISHDCEIPICQVRLDFNEFELQPPELGDCKKDQFIIQANDPIPVLCGSNTGQHVYIDVKGRANTNIHILTSPIYPKPFGHIDQSSGSYTLRNWLYETNVNRKLKLRVNQIPCDCTYDRVMSTSPRAPVGCLQYYTGVTGTLRSFNFEGVKYDLEPCWVGNETDCNRTMWTGHLNNLDYHICIRSAEDYCGITYEATGQESFLITGEAKFNDSLVDSYENLYGSTTCQSDYIVVPRSRTLGESKLVHPRDRYCGMALGNSAKGSIVSYSKPFHVQTRTDADEFTGSLDTENRGFELDYTQLPCSGMHLFNSDK